MCNSLVVRVQRLLLSSIPTASELEGSVQWEVEVSREMGEWAVGGLCFRAATLSGKKQETSYSWGLLYREEDLEILYYQQWMHWSSPRPVWQVAIAGTTIVLWDAAHCIIYKIAPERLTIGPMHNLIVEPQISNIRDFHEMSVDMWIAIFTKIIAIN